MKIQKEPTIALRKRRHALLHQLPPLQAILRGSLIERYKRCGKPGCKCAEGPGHGPKYYLSVSYPGLRPQMDYVHVLRSWDSSTASSVGEISESLSSQATSILARSTPPNPTSNDISMAETAGRMVSP